MCIRDSVKDAPIIDKDSDEVVTEFIDKYITCSVPDKEQYPKLQKVVTSVQVHSHTQTCKKSKQPECRFSFPQPPTDYTRIVRKKSVIPMLRGKRER